MATNGGGPPRKSHTKSRKGCRTCKIRHIRCDEAFPQCRNCSKHNVRCDYLDVAKAGDELPKGRSPPDLLTTPQLQEMLDTWRMTGETPLPELLRDEPSYWTTFSTIELRLIHHITTEVFDLGHRGYASCLLWTPRMSRLISIALENDFTMSALLALSATHLAWRTGNSETEYLAHTHRGTAFKCLHDALGHLSQTNAEAILASSILLSWQARDWQTWKFLHNGITTLMSAMRPWLQQSELLDYVDTILPASRPSQPLSPISTTGPPYQLGVDGADDLDLISEAFSTLRLRLASFPSHMIQSINDVLKWINTVRQGHLLDDPARQYERLLTFRSMIFWLPSSILRPDEADLGALAMISHFYALAIVLRGRFSDCEGMYLDTLVIDPLENICQNIQSRAHAMPTNTALQTAVSMLEVPMQIASNFRSSRMRRLAASPPRPSNPTSPFSPTQVLPLQNIGQHSFPEIQSASYTSYEGQYHLGSHSGVPIAGHPMTARAHSDPRTNASPLNTGIPLSNGDYFGHGVAQSPVTMHNSVSGFYGQSGSLTKRPFDLPQPVVPSNGDYKTTPPPLIARSRTHEEMPSYASDYVLKQATNYW